MQVYILGPNLELLPIGASGELCIAGIHVAKGYLRRKDESRRTFVSNPYGMGTHDRRLFRSGERARWLPDGTLQLQGRMDEQVRGGEKGMSASESVRCNRGARLKVLRVSM